MIAAKVLGLTQRVWEEDYFVGSQCSSMAFTTRVEQAVSHLYLRNTQTFCSVAISIAFTALLSLAGSNKYKDDKSYKLRARQLLPTEDGLHGDISCVL